MIPRQGIDPGATDLIWLPEPHTNLH